MRFTTSVPAAHFARGLPEPGSYVMTMSAGDERPRPIKVVSARVDGDAVLLELVEPYREVVVPGGPVPTWPQPVEVGTVWPAA